MHAENLSPSSGNLTNITPDVTSPNNEDLAYSESVGVGTEEFDNSWGLSISIDGVPHKFGLESSQALWVVARAAELQKGDIASVESAVDLLLPEVLFLAASGDTAPSDNLVFLCTALGANAIDTLPIEEVLSQTWAQTVKGIPPGVVDFLPVYLNLLDDCIDKTAPEAVQLDFRLTALAAIAVWAGLLSNESTGGWQTLLSSVPNASLAAGSLLSLDKKASITIHSLL